MSAGTRVAGLLSRKKAQSVSRVITYKAPSDMMAISVIFCRLGICNLLMNGIGNMRIEQSVAMLIPALAKNKLLKKQIQLDRSCHGWRGCTCANSFTHLASCWCIRVRPVIAHWSQPYLNILIPIRMNRNTVENAWYDCREPVQYDNYHQNNWGSEHSFDDKHPSIQDENSELRCGKTNIVAVYTGEEILQRHGVHFVRHELRMPAAAIANLYIVSVNKGDEMRVEDVHAHAGIGICSFQCS